MAATKTWTVQVLIEEEGDVTRADAVLRTGDDTALRGSGRARRNPKDQDVPEIGDELAAARALSHLAHALLEAAAADVEASAGGPVRLDA
jgi:hypothetical protein